METTHKPFPFSQEPQQLPQVDPLRPTPHLNHLEDLASHLESPQAEANIQLKYYDEFRKIYFTSYKLWSQLSKQAKIKDSLTHKITSIDVPQRQQKSQLTALHKTRRLEEEVQLPDEGETQRKSNKRTRRTAEEIERKYNCKAQFCDRCYGSQGSLQQHIKLKHPQIYKLQLSDSHQLQL